MITRLTSAILPVLLLSYASDLLAAPKLSVAVAPGVISEGNNFNFDFKLTEPTPPEGLTLRLALYRDSDPQLGDVSYFVDGSRNITAFELVRNNSGQLTDMRVTLAGNVRSARLTSLVLDDGVPEPEERAVFALAYQGTRYDIDPKQDRVDFTLTDFPVVSVSSPRPSAKEGEQIALLFRLSKPAPAGGLRIRLATLENSDPAPGDLTYLTDGSTQVTGYETGRGTDDQLDNLYVTIEAGATAARFVSTVTVDNVRERSETLTLSLAVGGDYSIDAAANTVRMRFIDKAN
ncbi:MAG: hypothetical protein ACKOZX_05405 [Gammaproteobacteria bacterium]